MGLIEIKNVRRYRKLLELLNGKIDLWTGMGWATSKGTQRRKAYLERELLYVAYLAGELLREGIPSFPPLHCFQRTSQDVHKIKCTTCHLCFCRSPPDVSKAHLFSTSSCRGQFLTMYSTSFPWCIDNNRAQAV